MNWRRRAVGLAVAVSLSVVAVACGDDDSDSLSAATTAADAEVTETTTAPAGTDAIETTDAPAATSAPESTVPVEVSELKMTTLDGTLLSLAQHVAIEQGFFEENAIDVTLVPVASGPAAVQALLAGEADVMLNSPDFVILANDQGQSTKFVVGNTDRAVITLVARNEWSLPNAGTYPEVVADLKGANIGVTARGSVVENQLRIMLEDAGLDPDKDVTIVATGLLDTTLPALQSGQIDAWMGFEPGTTITLEQTKVAQVVVDLRKGEGPAELENYPTNAFAFKQEYLDANGNVVERFVAAIVAAQEWMQDPANREELEAIVAGAVTIEPTLIPQLLDANLETFGAVIPEDGMTNAINLMVKNGLITEAPEFSDVVATEYAPAE